MPTYDYFCDVCKHTLEVFQKITDAHLEECPACKKHSLKRRPGGGIGLSFSGSGFYITDYKKNSASEGDSPAATGGGCCPCGKKSADACQTGD